MEHTASLRRTQAELTAVTGGTVEATEATEEQTKALRDQLKLLQEREFADEPVRHEVARVAEDLDAILGDGADGEE